MTVPLLPAKESDFPAIIALMNAAFRGIGSEAGWNIETDLITGERTNESLLREEIAKGTFYLLANHGNTPALQGCVSLRPVSPERWNLGSLTVHPASQKSGFGRGLLEAAEQYAAALGARTMEMTVVNLRDSLISWYERRGYQRTGETRPFPYGDHRYGTPMRSDLEFVVLQRRIDNIPNG